MLGVLCTHPERQGRGAGTVLLEYGLKLADKYGLESFLEASAKGYPLYAKYGFENAVFPDGKPALLEFDVGRFTRRGAEEGDWVRLTLMTKKPKTKSKN